MNDNQFWDLIQRFDWDETGDDDAVLEPACEALAALDGQQIFLFEDILASTPGRKSHPVTAGQRR